MKRTEIQELLKFGSFPSEQQVNLDLIRQQEALVKKIKSPVTDEEAKALLTIFGPDDYFGLAWTLLHLIETAPNWPINECLVETSNEWVKRLKQRAQRGKAANTD
jgi:hypothetical protein